MVMWIVLVLYLCLMIGIGAYYRTKNKNTSDFVLGGRTLGSWFTAFAYGTSYFSAVIFVGFAGKFGWNYGVASTWVGIGNAIIGSLIAWIVLGNRTRVMSKSIDARTMPEFFERRYQSKGLKLASAVIIFIFLIPYTASAFNGLSRLFEKAFHVNYYVCIVVMGLITAVYVIVGGYKATALNDFIQGLFMLVGITACIINILGKHGGLGGSIDALSQIEVNGKTNVYSSVLGPDPINLVGVVILTSLGTWGLPQMVTKFYTIKDEQAIKSGTVISTIFAVVVAGGCYFQGGFGRLFVKADENGAPVSGSDGIIPTMMESLPELLFGVVIVLVLSASMSTLSSLVLTSSSTLTLDMIKPLMKKKMSDKTEMLVMRVFVGVFLAVSCSLAIFTLENEVTIISSLMSISWGALAGAFIGPFLWGLYKKNITRAAVWFSFICGVSITVGHMIWFTFGGRTLTVAGIAVHSPINAGAFAMLFSIVAVPLVSLFTKKPDTAEVDKVFTDIDASKKGGIPVSGKPVTE
ncbi:MAG: sodium:solute symporter [Ruminococcus sp.]|nr:sodium:solute symporter [Ruminococcus sp.]